MVTVPNKVAMLGLAAALGLGAMSPANAASLGTGAAGWASATPAHVVQVGGPGWGPPGPRYYPPPRGRCWNCNNNNGAAVGAGIALGILGAAAIAGAASAANTPPPPVYYAPAPPPPTYYAPPPAPYQPPAPHGQCWFPTDTRGAGYWAAC